MILVIDTASSKIKLALDGKTAEFASQKQSIDLPARVAELLDGKTPQAIGVVTGPGSFTGIRLGLAYAKGLAMGWNIPLVGINMFELAEPSSCLAIDSGRGDYFIAEGGEYCIEKELPPGARLVTDYDLTAGVDIVREKLAAGNTGPVIPLYIRPSYVGE